MAITDRYVTSGGGGTYAGSTSPAAPMSLTTAFANAVAGDRINIKNDGTYTRTGTDTLTNSGTVGQPIIYRGYSNTIGDGNQGRTNTNGALIPTNLPLIAYNAGFRYAPNTFTITESLNITGSITSAISLVGLLTDSVLKSCKVLNSGASGASLTVGAASTAPNCVIFDNDIEQVGSSTAHAVDVTGVAQRVIANRVKGGTGIGIYIGGSSSAVIIGNVVYASTGFGISVGVNTARPTIYGNTVVGGTVEGINIVTGTTSIQCIINNLITDNTTYGVEYVSTANGAFAAYNRYRDNTTANTHNAGDFVAATSYAEITSGNGTSDYVAAGSNNYDLVPTSPAIGAGWFRYGTVGAIDPVRTAATGSTRIPSIGG